MATEKWKRMYGTWNSMKQRCYNKNNPGFRHYGAKGITICDRWIDDHVVYRGVRGKLTPKGFLNFYDDMGGSWFLHATIDRIDSRGDYCLHNCKWATNSENVSRMGQEHVSNGTHHLLSGCIQRKAQQNRAANGTHNFMNKKFVGVVTALDITTHKFVRITKEEYWENKGIRYFCHNSKVVRSMSLGV